MAYHYYCLKLELKKGQEITVGKKGREFFPPGFYFYVGRARKGIRARVARHFSPRKKKRWHIDYLSSVAFPVAVQVFPENSGSECRLAEMLAARGGTVIFSGFGSSDCRCPTHLYFFSENECFPGE